MTKLTTLLMVVLLLGSCGCGKIAHAHVFSSDADILDYLGYTGPNRAVYWIGDTKCYTNDDTRPYPQADLKCY